ncbi:hypothetical protein NN3_60120 [Nocardia neocaledoniensis NBRC 108232]|uniref:Uncharacterized protein n=1 Tax=Nocardia neocaledoniensis TaxID=236511 RepID=A0A317NMM6_9NOCA|nr:hypothetical protein [Nocardia neocaledoniensis]PWV76255.1 hypothetical protein DFR69_104358 [Nocardia neocaledoniensis]GEM35005.1 hypothetical protein NN3_60120 [Nocardia neocaledoniensis NBRC 108232]
MTAHRPAQIARLSATVVAGAASLCLTVAAGAYIVNNMPELAPAPTREHAEPGSAPAPGGHQPTLAEGGSPRFTSDFVQLAVFTERAPSAPVPTPVTTQRSTTAAAPNDSTLAGRLRIGTTYVGAQVAPARTDTISFTVDTNVVTIASKYLGVTADPAGVTALRTELDTRRGELMFVLSDPALGSHTLRVERIQKPGTAPADQTTAAAEPADEQAEAPADEAPTTVGV